MTAVQQGTAPALLADPPALVRGLEAAGWGERQFAKNQLLYEWERARGVEGAGTAMFQRFWRTVARLHEVLTAAGITPVFLKCRRHYPYGDGNVDVLVSRGDWPRVIQALEAAEWRVPPRAVRIKQNLIEKSKLKLPARTDGLYPAHLYGAVSWRYQSDVGFLPQGEARNPFLEAVPLRSLWAGAPEVEVLMPTRAADLLIHGAQTVFENYRLYLGEALYMDHLWRTLPASEVAAVEELARGRGALPVLRLVRAHLDDRLARPFPWPPGSWPNNLAFPALLSTWTVRAGRRWGEGKRVRAVEELFGYFLFATLYAGKRGVWDRMKGRGR